jgi:pyridoxamine 5'-phosphate oxidase
MSIADLRREYERQGLSEADLAPDPVSQLRIWLDQAISAGIPDPTAMVLATVGPDSHPSARVVLLKGLDARGLAFFTNYQSRKGRELSANPRAAVAFYWSGLERQVRVEGNVERVSPAESDEYFRTRPVDAQLGAWTSAQSEIITGGRAALEERLSAIVARFTGSAVPRPPQWGGYRLVPAAAEFWQGRPGRLHDRLRYSFDGRRWQVDRLAP